MRKGRPSIYTEKLADAICSEIMLGQSVKTICSRDGFPSQQTIYQWIQKRPIFAEKYARAKEVCADYYADLMHEIVDENPQIQIPTKVGSYTATDSAGVARNRLRWDNLRWHASKLAPKKYGDKIQQEVSGPAGAAIQIISTIPRPEKG